MTERCVRPRELARAHAGGASTRRLAVTLVALCTVLLMLLSGCQNRVTPAPPATPNSSSATSATPVGTDPSRTTTPNAGIAASAVITKTPTAAPELVIAWQPSHQNDTGSASWHEYRVCGDIVDRCIRLLPQYRHVKAWDLDHGLTGSNNYRPRPSNTRAFDVELAKANEAHADVFISVHNDGGAPSGVLGEYSPGDAKGKELCERLVAGLVSELGLPDRGLRAVHLYSLEPTRNRAEYRCLLEIGDNKADRALLNDPAQRERIAVALAAVLSQWR